MVRPGVAVEAEQSTFPTLRTWCGSGLGSENKNVLVREIMPGMECFSGRKERITGSRLSKSGFNKDSGIPG